MPYLLFLLMLSCCFSIIWSQQEPCQMYFTLQPPADIPCNPYIFKHTRLSLECMVTAPALNANLQELNFTIEWMKSSDNPGSAEETVYTSYPDDEGFEVVTKRSSHTYGESGLVMSVFVKSTLSIDINQASHMELSGKYWCRVLAKNLENYSYSIAGDSGTVTVLKSKSHYLNNYPPCVVETSLHHAELKCVEDVHSPPPLTTASTNRKTYQVSVDTIVVYRGDLPALALAGGILFVFLLIMSFMVVYLVITLKGLVKEMTNFCKVAPEDWKHYTSEDTSGVLKGGSTE